ncbi:MAG TPA: aminopeptidase N [Mycobacteriales bacterium]
MKNLSRDEAVQRAALLRVESYEVRLDLTAAPSGSRFGTRTTIVFECLSPGADTFVEHAVPVWESAVFDGTPLDLATVQGNRLPLRGLAAGRHTLAIAAQADYSHTGEGLSRTVDPADGAVYLYQQSFLDDAQRTFACFDQPDLKAAVTLTAQVPPGWLMAANARGSQDGDTWSFQPTERISTYLVSLAAGPFHVARDSYDGIDLGLWCRASMAAHLDAADLFTVTKQSFDLQQRLFGRPYPFGDTYDQVFVPGFNAGAMENPGLVTFTDDFLFRSKVTLSRRRLRASVVAHEMAHMWFGDLVTMRWWDDLWLNESFAELLGTLTVDEATGLPGCWPAFTVGRKAWGYAADQLPTTHPVATDVGDNQSALLNFDGISYAKGASVLRQLMAYVGRDAFFTGVRAYLDRRAFGNSTLADLLSALSDSSGRELREWADVWLRTTGVSTLRPSWDGSTLTVIQESPTPRIARIGVGRWDLVDGVLRRRDLTKHDVVAGSTVLPLTGPRPDLVLLNDGDLAFVKVRFDERSAETLLRHLWTIDDDLSRALCWAALWDSTRDAELPAWAYLEAVLAGAAVEDDPEQVETLLSQARTAAVRYLPAADRPAALRGLADAWWASAVAARPGSDVQLVYVRAFTAVADDDRLESLLGPDGDAPSAPSGDRSDTVRPAAGAGGPDTGPAAGGAGVGSAAGGPAAGAGGPDIGPAAGGAVVGSGGLAVDSAAVVVPGEAGWAAGEPDAAVLGGLPGVLPAGPSDGGPASGVQPAGLVVDAELRWLVLRRLAALGRAGSDRIDAELRRDPTAAGQREHAAALAARPLPEGKEAAFVALTEPAELTNDLARAIAGGFWQRGQEELLRPWSARYFAALPGIWSACGPAVAAQLTRLLYPQLDEPATLEQTDAFLAGPDVPPGCRRLVLEQRDDVARALRAIGAA